MSLSLPVFLFQFEKENIYDKYATAKRNALPGRAIERRASNLIVTNEFPISLAQATLFPLFALQ